MSEQTPKTKQESYLREIKIRKELLEAVKKTDEKILSIEKDWQEEIEQTEKPIIINDHLRYIKEVKESKSIDTENYKVGIKEKLEKFPREFEDSFKAAESTTFNRSKFDTALKSNLEKNVDINIKEVIKSTLEENTTAKEVIKFSVFNMNEEKKEK